jgi:hypothetical protein
MRTTRCPRARGESPPFRERFFLAMFVVVRQSVSGVH